MCADPIVEIFNHIGPNDANPAGPEEPTAGPEEPTARSEQPASGPNQVTEQEQSRIPQHVPNEHDAHQNPASE